MLTTLSRMHPTHLWLGLITLILGVASPLSRAEMSPEEAQSGTLLLRNSSGTYQQALNLNTNANVRISGITAQVELTQQFENDSDQWREAIYVFPLPEDAAVHRMEIHVNDRIIIGKVKEKNEAKKIYQKAKQEGKIAALTEQERPNLFTQNVANIPPQATITVKLHYQHSVHYDMGAFSWRLPMTVTPRYIPGTPLAQKELNNRFDTNTSAINTFGWATPTTEVSDAHRITPPMQPSNGNNTPSISIQIMLHSGLPLADIRSAYHRIEINENEGVHSIQLQQSPAQQTTIMNRDFVLEWLPESGHSPSAGVFSETIDGEYYASIVVVPSQAKQRRALERDITFVIDTSGSMAGVSIRQAKQSLILALNRLKPGDRFNVIEFNSSFSRLFNQLTAADAGNISHAKRWVGRLNADGGTEMLSALDAALTSFNDKSRLQQLVFITDGAIGNETQLFKRIQSGLGSTRLFAVGIGSAPNSYFMKKAAQFGRGSATYIGDVSEVASKMNELFMKLETALVTNIQVDWGAEAEQYPAHIGDLYAGEPLLLTAKLKTPSSGIGISGTTLDESWTRFLQVNTSVTQTGIARNWARAKIEALEDTKVAGADPTEVRQSVLTLALQHQLISPYTSFVAVEQQISRPQKQPVKTQPIANAMPMGSQQAIPFSRTATPMPLLLWLGALCLTGFLRFRHRGA